MTTSLFGGVRPVHLCAFLPDGKTRHRSTRGDRLPNPWPILFVPAQPTIDPIASATGVNIALLCRLSIAFKAMRIRRPVIGESYSRSRFDGEELASNNDAGTNSIAAR